MDELGDRDYDFVIGSIHWLRDSEGRFRWPHLGTGGTEEFGGDKKFVLKILGETRKMIEFRVLDCVGHLDAFVR